MTRKQAKKALSDEFTNNDKIVDKIYDEFESRICENCKHCSILCIAHSRESIECLNTNSPMAYKETRLSFGCNKFLRKDNE